MANTDVAAGPESEPSGFFANLKKKLLLYPTMFTAILGAIPTAVDMYKANAWGLGLTNFRNVAQAEKQRELWKKNFFCSSQAKVNTIKTDQGVTINVLACPSGDVLTTVLKSDKVAISKWITLDEIQQASLASVFTSVANAAPVESMTPNSSTGGLRFVEAVAEVKCQAWSIPGQEINRVISKEGKCFAEKVNVLTGKTLESKEVPCDTQCKK